MDGRALDHLIGRLRLFTVRKLYSIGGSKEGIFGGLYTPQSLWNGLIALCFSFRLRWRVFLFHDQILMLNLAGSFLGLDSTRKRSFFDWGHFYVYSTMGFRHDVSRFRNFGIYIDQFWCVIRHIEVNQLTALSNWFMVVVFYAGLWLTSIRFEAGVGIDCFILPFGANFHCFFYKKLR